MAGQAMIIERVIRREEGFGGELPVDVWPFCLWQVFRVP
jgi:hypothetical protein